MLAVQEFLKEFGLDELKNRYKIKVTEHPTDNRILLNYDQIESPKTAEVVRDCRGLCLDKRDFSLISRSFRRFFNFGENLEDTNNFDWNDCICLAKEDGTLVQVYWYEDAWRVQTRGSFGDIPFYPDGPTPSELVFQILGDRINGFHKEFSYALELCSKHNKVVRDYDIPQLFLLAVFKDKVECPFDGLFLQCYSVLNHSFYTDVQLPELFSFHSIKEVEDYIRERSKKDKTFEGIVIRDKNNIRLKIKNPDYLALHRMKGEGSNLFMPKNLIGFILDGEEDELLTYFKEVEPKINAMKKILKEEYIRVEETWEKIKGLPTRKEFALAMPKDIHCKALLFNMLQSQKPLKELWSESRDYLLKCLF